MIQYYRKKKQILKTVILSMIFVMSAANAHEFKCHVKGQDQRSYIVLIDTGNMQNAMSMAKNVLITRNDKSKVGVAEIMECTDEHKAFRQFNARIMDKRLPR